MESSIIRRLTLYRSILASLKQHFPFLCSFGIYTKQTLNRNGPHISSQFGIKHPSINSRRTRMKYSATKKKQNFPHRRRTRQQEPSLKIQTPVAESRNRTLLENQSIYHMPLAPALDLQCLPIFEDLAHICNLYFAFTNDLVLMSASTCEERNGLLHQLPPALCAQESLLPAPRPLR